jgi:cathepsin B
MLITKDFINQLKETVPWEVVEYEDNIFKDWTLEDARRFFSARIDKPKTNHATFISNVKLPDNFDPRKEKFSKCIHPILNQGHCGSCWAHGSSEVLSDRFCINGKDVILSPQDLTSCDRYDNGCNGGGLEEPFRWMTNFGIVTATCFPYVSGDGHVPPCPSKCVNTEAFTKYKCAPGTIVSIDDNTAQKQEMYDHGPMDTGFYVYEDFMNYKGGIYVHKTGKMLGGHAVKVMGWGVEGGVKYWICANSWGAAWGESGFFRIKLGECDIDGGVACSPKL